MKSQPTISALLGLTQHQMASLLHISPSHYSMFESGKRSLPLPAQQLLAEMLTHMQSGSTAKKANETGSQKELHEYLTYLVKENTYQRLRLEREIAALEKKHAKAERIVHLSAFFKSRKATAMKGDRLGNAFSGKIDKAGNRNHETDLMKLLVKQELLEQESIFLQSKLENVALG